MLGIKKKTIIDPEELKREKLANLRVRCSMARLSKMKACDTIKASIDKKKAERLTLRENAISAIERGDELEARRICAIISPTDLAIDRETKLFMLNLKAMEALTTKGILLNIIDVTDDLELDNELFDIRGLSEVVDNINEFELEMDVISDSISDVTQSERTDEIFDSLVREVQKKQEAMAFNKLEEDSTVTPVTADTKRVS